MAIIFCPKNLRSQPLELAIIVIVNNAMIGALSGEDLSNDWLM